MWVIVPGRVVSKANHRQKSRTSGAASWSAVAAYETEVATELRRARPATWPHVPSVLPAKSERHDIVSVIAARTRMDVGNISKSILDAGQYVLYTSDSQISASAELVERNRQDQATLIAFACVTPGVNKEHALIELLASVTKLLYSSG
jgi:Holliday junction resolvase RusA-like endonuclease